MQNAIQTGGLIDGISSLLDVVVDKAREANLKHCLPIGKPIIVIHHITPEKNQQIPCHNPPHKNQIIFPRQPIIKSPN